MKGEGVVETFQALLELVYDHVDQEHAFGSKFGIGKEEFIDRIFQENMDVAHELYGATEIRKTVSEGLLLERAGESVDESEEAIDRDGLLLSLMEEQRHQILEDVQLLMSQERAKTFRRYVLREGNIDVDLMPLLDSNSPAFEELRSVIETRLSFPGKLATLERVLLRDDSYLFFMKYVDKIKYAEEMDGRHWDTLIRRVFAVFHPPSRTLEIGTPDHNRESRTLSTLSRSSWYPTPPATEKPSSCLGWS